MFREKPYHPSNAYFIKKVQPKVSNVHGVGVYALENIAEKEIFEVSPVLLYTPSVFNLFSEETESRHIHENYVFWWEPGKIATGWGYTSLYNHMNGEGANAGYRLRKTDAPAIEVYAKRDIAKGDEIFLHYMHHKFDLEFDETGEWWNIEESDASSSFGGYDTGIAKLMSDTKKSYR